MIDYYIVPVPSVLDPPMERRNLETATRKTRIIVKLNQGDAVKVLADNKWIEASVESVDCKIATLR